MAKIIEIVEERDNFGNASQNVQERNAVDSYSPVVPEPTLDNPALLQAFATTPVVGKVYTITFNTSRDIKLDPLPYDITVFGKGIRVENIYHSTPIKLCVDYSILS